jgi:release factor glutamine methyltransferase
MTSRELLARGELPARELLILLSHELGIDQAALYRDIDRPLPTPSARRLQRQITKRRAGWPLQYVTGRAWFWSLPIEVGRGVLVPRPETETLVEAACRLAPQGGSLADIGTGSGAILAAMAVERPDLRLTGVDRSITALRYAEKNVDSRAQLLQGDLCKPLSEPQDVIVANLPYIPRATYADLPADVRHEPRQALVGGADGLDPVRRLIRQAPEHLRPDGWLLLEVGDDQSDAVAALLARGGFREIFRQTDLAGVERVVGGRRACTPN